MAGGKGKSAAGGKTPSADAPRKQQSHSARAGLQVRFDLFIFASTIISSSTNQGLFSSFFGELFAMSFFFVIDAPRAQNRVNEINPLFHPSNVHRASLQYYRTRRLASSANFTCSSDI